MSYIVIAVFALFICTAYGKSTHKRGMPLTEVSIDEKKPVTSINNIGIDPISVAVNTEIVEGYSALNDKLLNLKPGRKNKLYLAHEYLNSLHHLLRNRHIVFIGDSLMRFQYLDLVYSLRHQNVVHPKMKPNFLEEGDWLTWNEFHKGTNGLLSPNEFCDCYRERDVSHHTKEAFENRYYHDSFYNVTVTYLQYFGDMHELHGHWSYGENDTNRQIQHRYIAPSWSYNLTWTLINYVQVLLPHPSFLIINAGHWANHLNNRNYAREIASIGKNVSDHFIWKTTTYPKSKDLNNTLKSAAYSERDINMCSMAGVGCLNMSWTRFLESNSYRDNLHFKSEVYTRMNMQFLSEFVV